jgi:hypothetical protein
LLAQIGIGIWERDWNEATGSHFKAMPIKKREQQLMQLPNVVGVGIGEKGISCKESLVIAKVVADT